MSKKKGADTRKAKRGRHGITDAAGGLARGNRKERRLLDAWKRRDQRRTLRKSRPLTVEQLEEIRQGASLGGPLDAMLAVAIPHWIEKMRNWTFAERQEKAQQLAFDCVTQQGVGTLASGEGHVESEPAVGFNGVAQGVAILAFQPDGVTFAGARWDASKPQSLVPLNLNAVLTEGWRAVTGTDAKGYPTAHEGGHSAEEIEAASQHVEGSGFLESQHARLILAGLKVGGAWQHLRPREGEESGK